MNSSKVFTLTFLLFSILAIGFPSCSDSISKPEFLTPEALASMMAEDPDSKAFFHIIAETRELQSEAILAGFRSQEVNQSHLIKAHSSKDLQQATEILISLGHPFAEKLARLIVKRNQILEITNPRYQPFVDQFSPEEKLQFDREIAQLQVLPKMIEAKDALERINSIKE